MKQVKDSIVIRNELRLNVIIHKAIRSQACCASERSNRIDASRVLGTLYVKLVHDCKCDRCSSLSFQPFSRSIKSMEGR